MENEKKFCLYCKKEIPKKRKYYDTLCKYRYNSITNHKPTKFKIIQHLRMNKGHKKLKKNYLFSKK